jgi:hypothetical protein
MVSHPDLDLSHIKQVSGKPCKVLGSPLPPQLIKKKVALLKLTQCIVHFPLHVETQPFFKSVLKNRIGNDFGSCLSLPKRLEMSMLLPASLGFVPC